MGLYQIPLVWQMYGHVNITADTLEEAIKTALGPEVPLPEGNYVDDSVQVDEDVLYEWNPPENDNQNGGKKDA